MAKYLVTVKSLGVFETKVLVEAPSDAEAQNKAQIAIRSRRRRSFKWRALEPRGVPDTEHVERIG